MENLAYKFVLMRFPAFGNHVTNCNQGLSQSKTENPGNEVVLVDPLIGLKINLILLLSHYKELQTSTFMATKTI